MYSRKLDHILYLFSLVAFCVVTVITPLFVSVKANESQTLEIGVLFPTEMAPVTTTSGKWVDVAFEITGASADYYITTITIAENGNSANIIGEYTQLIRLNIATKSITRQVTLDPGIADGAYDVIVRADIAEDFDPANSPSDTAESAVLVGDIQGLSQGALLVSKSLIIAGALLDQWVPSSNLNEFYLSGDAVESLSDVGRDTVDCISEAINKKLFEAINEGLDGAGEVADGTKGTVISEAPFVIDGALNLLLDIVELFNTEVPLEP